MLRHALSALRSCGTKEHGFTLVELLVSMMTGVIVIGALYGLLFVTLDQTQHQAARVDATRQARIALANIENELHSACATSSAPIQANSDGNSVQFLSYYGPTASPTPAWHTLAFSSTSKTLTDTTYSATYSNQKWIQGTFVSKTTLLTNVAAQTGTPVFQYYAYQQYPSGGTTYMVIPDGTNILPSTGTIPQSSALTTPLSTTVAATAVEVAINLQVGPANVASGAPNTTGVADPVSDAVLLRFTTPPNYLTAGMKTGTWGPCQ